jgi:hypothetical protein
MKVIPPLPMTNAVIAASNVTEDDFPQWDISTSYGLGDKVIVIGTTHKVYESAQGSNIGNDPTTDTGVYWIELGATNRWKAFDGRVSDVVTSTGTITYSFTPSATITGLAFLGLNAGSVKVSVTDSSVARRNLFAATAEFEDNTRWSWLGIASVTDGAAANPIDGALTADKLIEDTSTGAHRVQRNVSMTAGSVYLMSLYAKAAERDEIRLQMNAGAFAGQINATFNLSTLAVSATSAFTEGFGIEAAGDGWFRVWVWATATTTASPALLIVIGNAGSTNYTGDGSGILVYGPQVEVITGSVFVPSRYQYVSPSSVHATDTFLEVRSLVDNSAVPDWFDYYFGDIAFDSEAIFEGVPGYTTATVSVEIDAGAGTAEVGQIVLGRVATLGQTLEGSRLGIRDFSFKDFDAFGRAQIVERRFARNVDFSFAMPASDARRVDRTLASLRATPAVYYADAAIPQYGAIAFGFFRDFDIPLQHQGKSFVTLEIEGLT